MKILDLEYVDPLDVLQLNMQAFGYPLTPEQVLRIRRMDLRPFPCFTIYSFRGDQITGQIGILRQPITSVEGREDVGGIWLATAYSTAYEVDLSPLLDEAETQMRSAGLQFSTLMIRRDLKVYELFRKNGYIDMNVWASGLANWDLAHQPTRLRAEFLGAEGYDFIENFFPNLAADYLGFSGNHSPLVSLRDRVKPEKFLVLWENAEPVGYVIFTSLNSVLTVDVQILGKGIDAAEAIAAVSSKVRSHYITVDVYRPTDIARLRSIGWRVFQPTYRAFMIKPLVPQVTVADARRLFGIGTDQFLISSLDFLQMNL